MNIRLRALALAAAFGCGSALADGNPEHGKQLYAKICTACHSLDANLAGPAHRGVFGRKAGSVAGFDYSAALKQSQVVWNEAALNQWLAGPEKFIPGQKMWISVPEAQDRADLIAYLKSAAAR